MKKNWYIVLVIITIGMACKKSADTMPETTYVIKSIEYKTNIPLPGVTIRLYECSKYDFEFGCQATALLATHITNSNGEYMITQKELNQADEGIVLSKTQYGDMNGGTGDVLMEPEAWVQLALKTNKSYPDTTFFQLKTTSEFGIASLLSFIPPKDSTVRFRLFGNEVNKVDWMVFTKDGIRGFYCIIDTLDSGSLTLSPQKFQTLTSSVNY
jgi:hypothetical protein